MGLPSESKAFTSRHVRDDPKINTGRSMQGGKDTLRDEASFLALEGVVDGKCCPTPVAMVWQVRCLYAVAQE